MDGGDHGGPVPGSYGGLGLRDAKWQAYLGLLRCPRPIHASLHLGPRLLLPLPRPIPSKPPAALANGARCCFRENTFWSLLSEPSQLTPTVEKMCQDKWKISS